jgi:putative N6-adenine-specific DNA methylase
LKNHYFGSCPRGLEDIFLKELLSINATDLEKVDGGILFAGDHEVLYRANISSRIATRIMCLVKKGIYEKEEDIFQSALEINWDSWFDVNKTIKVTTTAIKCPLKSVDFMTLRIKDAICDFFREKFAKRPNVNIREPDIKVHLFLERNNFAIYLDASGDPLYQRGFRKASVEAPIKENLAAGIIKLSGWEPGQAFFDPMCGSGTFLIEAALIATNQPPGLKRDFGFMQWKNFDKLLFESLKKSYQNMIIRQKFLRIYGSDKDLRAVRVSKKNLVLAGFENNIQLACQEFNEIKPPLDEGVLVTNPPYGERIGEDEALNNAYPEWARTLKQSFAGWRAYFLTNDFNMPKLMRLAPSKKTPLFNGALDCRLFEIKMVAGSNRK